MSISKLLKSNNLIFFVIALVLMGFAVHSLGNRKNNMIDGLAGSRDLSPSDLDTDSDTESEFGQMDMSEGSAPRMSNKRTSVGSYAGSHAGSHARSHARSHLAKPAKSVDITDPKELLPKEKSDSFHNRDLINAGRFISQQSDVLRNANLQLRSDPPVGKAHTGPFNQTTIEPDKLRPQFELSGGIASSGSITGFSKNCPMWMSSKLQESNNAILPPGHKNVSSE